MYNNAVYVNFIVHENIQRKNHKKNCRFKSNNEITRSCNYEFSNDTNLSTD